MKKSIGSAAFLAAASAWFTAAGAQPQVVVEGTVVPTAQVDYGDLNLSSPRGVEILQRRIRHAAQEMCRTPGLRPLAERLAAGRCVETAIASADGQVRQALAEFGSERFAARATIALRLAD